MKKNTFLFAIIAMIATSIFTSCEKDYEFIQPEASYIAIAPNPCYVGDTVAVFLAYKTMGQYWYYTKQEYSVDGKVVISKTKPNGGGLNDHAEAKFIVTEAGEHTISFSSQISIYAGKNNPYAIGPSVSGQKFTVLEREEDEDGVKLVQ